ncbi:MAG: spermidine/putrescine ABC transporter ATP-binding protein [Phototrophicales bacterium]|nr:MAG: spermidine/putrescine ABC transporter ATP-binding protein [Phototrophicales bacterium]RMG70060.1 MAG: ABC transporter ATP-binding protein [Chloroflexota bacterium]
MNEIKIKLKNLVKEFPGKRGEEPVRAVDNLSINIYDGEFFALLGPSGCGKTTTLRMIAGFEQPTSGEILLDGNPIHHIPAYHRPVNTVFQDYALFPHMSVLQNIMFGLKMEKVPRKEAEQRAMEALEMVQLPHIAQRKPRELSGGQQQRVALARALVKRPSVLLLDEPLGALDLKLRRQMQLELKSMQQRLGITFIFVTHDQEEAMTMANRIAVMNQGVALQIGRPEEIYETPRTRFVADFIGETNFLQGQLIDHDGAIRLADNSVITASMNGVSAALQDQVTIAIRPERIHIQEYDSRLDNTLTNGTSHLTARVQQVYYIGTDTRYIVRLGDNTELSVRVQNTHTNSSITFSPNQLVSISWTQENARVLAD